jgi:hypothetical protein
MTPLLSVHHEGSKRIIRNNSAKHYGKIPYISRYAAEIAEALR